MDPVRYRSKPSLRRPVLVAAFAGWNDAGEAATSSVEFLRRAWDAEVFADVDPEEFFDFQVNRPQVRLVDGLIRKIEWPETSLASGRIAGSDRHAILLLGIEPSMRWRAFADRIVTLAREFDVEMLVTLGALLADVPHSRPVRVTGTAASQELVESLGLERSRYEGPTGIVGVLHDACSRAGLPSASLWAAVPHYVRTGPSPKAALELVRRLGSLVGFGAETAELEEATEAYEQRVAEAVAADPDIAAYVQMLENRSDEELREVPTGEQLAEELERFLQSLRPDDG